MKAEIRVEPANSIIRVNFAGEFDIEYYRSFYVKLVNRKDFKPGINMIWDISGLDLKKINTDLVMELGVISIENAKKRGNGKTAIVAGSDHQFGTARMFGSLYMNSLPVRFHPFRTLDEAEKWIESDQESDYPD